MKDKLFRKQRLSAMTILEMSIAMGIGTIILAGLTTASIALQRSYVAIEDLAKGQNDQMRISDYLALDMRRAYDIDTSGSSTNPPFKVTLTIPNYYQAPDSQGKANPYDPRIVSTMGWPYKNKKHHHHKHQNIVLGHVADYGTVAAPTVKVEYTFDNQAAILYRCVNGAVPAAPGQPDPAGVTTIARDVADFTVTLDDLDETATTKITFKPRFRILGSDAAADALALTATTYFQTTLTRNTSDHPHP